MSSTNIDNEELQSYQDLLAPADSRSSHGEASNEDLRIAPLIWWDVKENLNQQQSSSIQNGVKGSAPSDPPTTSLQQYAVLGHVPSETQSASETESALRKPVLLNTASPWSAFLCGSQGSGKSHTLSCMLENCLLFNPSIGKNPKPLAGLVFHYDSTQGTGVCEAAYLCSQVPTTVLVSPSNYGPLKAAYDEMAAKAGAKIEVHELKLLPKHLNTERVKTLMAIGKDDNMPLYMQVLIKILRDMALAEHGYDALNGNPVAFDYPTFRRNIVAAGFSDKQNGPLNLRLELLESFIYTTGDETTNDGTTKDKTTTNNNTTDQNSTKDTIKDNKTTKNITPSNSPTTPPDLLTGKPSHLTIIDLTDPVIDTDLACVLFSMCLSVFISQTPCGKIVALDEAHNYMSEQSTAVRAFTDKLLKTIREQRHQGTRMVVATQEPTLNTALLDLCSVVMVHRCTSPAWFAVLKKHVAGLFLNGRGTMGGGWWWWG